jgi:hypothetical protein
MLPSEPREAASPGFEPSLTGSEPVVLPLHYEAILGRRINPIVGSLWLDYCFPTFPQCPHCIFRA